jgi:serine/threonine protein kinase
MDIGDLLDHRYELRALLGSGGTATVYRAHDRDLDREVAIKVFGPTSELSDPARRRLEARALATLRHPAIVAIFDARLEADPPYLVLEYVEGPTLAATLTGGPLDGDRARRVAAAAASGLARAHADGIVHRDVKPANLLLPRDGDVAARLLDFGIAQSLGDPRRTTAGTVVGSAWYLSPEQARGEDVGPASDVYSLGLVLIECLTGRPAFPGSTPESVAARLLAGPSLTDPALAAEAPLLSRMTALEALDRPGAAEVAELLAAPAPTRVLRAATDAATEVLAPTEAVQVPPEQGREATARRGRRGRRRLPRAVLVASALGLAVVLVGAAGIGSLLSGTGAIEAGGKTRPSVAPVDIAPVDDAPGPGNGPGNGNGNPGDNGNGNGPKDD